MIEEHPDPKGQMTPFGSARSKLERVKSADSTSGCAKKTATSGLSAAVSLSQRLKE